jgi:glucose/arabinose dehydrogenase
MKNLYLVILLLAQQIYSQTIGLQRVISGLNVPVELVNAGDSRLFIVEQGGLIRILNIQGNNSTINAIPFLDVNTIVNQGGGEKGLLGLAFHPNYATNGTFFISYTRPLATPVSGVDCENVIAKYQVSSNRDIANINGTVVLTIQQPYNNHNGGCIRFGTDGYLYIGIGDGGSANDPENRSQNLNTLLGKLLRINVDNTTTYTIPQDNPFVGIDGRDEIWAYGLRNPWKFSFDTTNNQLWIADVGQNTWEEINRQPTTAVGLNYGWRCKEGNVDFITVPACTSTLTAPLVTVSHARPESYCSITGGYVYRGTQYPNLFGKYIFGDFCNDKIGITDSTTGATTYTNDLGDYSISSFGEDNSKNLYLVDYEGTIYKITDTSPLSTASFFESKTKIFPNPTEGILNISSEDAISNLKIYNLTGQEVFEKSGNFKESNIDIRSFAKGVYFLKIWDVNNNSFSQRVIKD